MPADQSQRIGRIADERSDPRTLIRAANRTTIAAIVDGVMGNESLLALIGEAGTGKTTLAPMLREELASHSVCALPIAKGEGGKISVRQIVAEVLGGPQSELTTADVQTFIEVMIRREQPAQRLVLIVDDAECLQPDALSCLLLLASLPRAVAAQIVFIGRPRFWRVLGHTEGAEGNGLIRRQWELAEPPGGGRRARDQDASRGRDDDPSADAPASVDAEEKADKRERPAQPVGMPGWQRGALGCLAAAAMVMFVVAPSRLADDHRTENSKLGGRLGGDQPSLERVAGAALATTQVAPADPRSPIVPAPPDTEAPDARTELAQPRAAGTTLSATSTIKDNPPNVAEGAVQAIPVNPPVSPGTLLLAASPAPATQAPLWAAPYEVTGLEISQAPEQPSTTVTSVYAAPHPPADVAPVPQTFGTEPLASAAQGAGGATAEATSHATDGATQASHETVEPPSAAALPPADAPTGAARSQPAVAEESRAGEPLAGTVPAATAPTEHSVTAGTAETPLHVEEKSKAPEPLLVDEPPHGASTETVAPHLSAEIAPPQAKPPAVEEQSPANAIAESVSRQPPPAAAAPVAAQPSGASSVIAAVAAPPPASASAGVATDKDSANPAVSNRLPSPPVAGPPLDLTLLLSRADAMLALGDISAARRLYERAAALGSARAATAAGKTYDPAFLASIGVQGIVPDQATATEWYRKAAALGDREAADHLAKLSPRN
jgi:hypothetical protein